MKSKSGVSLIVLVITIVIMIILSSAVLFEIGFSIDKLRAMAKEYETAHNNLQSQLNSLLKYDLVNNGNENVKVEATTLGIGGYGMLFSPKISPKDPNTMMAICDMGGVYVTNNKGVNWSRKELNGTCYTIEFDPNNQGAVYVGGSGLYKSTDNGKTFEIIFPKKESIIETIHKLEASMSYIYNTDGYSNSMVVKDILIDPNDSNHIYVLLYTAYYPREVSIYESVDGGSSFIKLVNKQEKESASSHMLMDYNEMFIHNGKLRLCMQEGIYEYNNDTGKNDVIYKTTTEIVDIAQVREGNDIYYILLEKSSEYPGATTTAVRYTKDFNTFTDLTTTLLNQLLNSEDIYNDFEWEFTFVEATSLTNIYLVQGDYLSSTNYPHGIIKYNGSETYCIYGSILKEYQKYKYGEALENPGWLDESIRIWGIDIDGKKDDNSILFTTICGVYYSPDSEKIYQRYSNVHKNNGKTTYSSTGIDVQVTYGVEQDPFNENNLKLLYSDLALASSDDGGKTWTRDYTKFPWYGDGSGKFVNTCYALEFDKYKEGTVYSIWSTRGSVKHHVVSGNMTTNSYGVFAVSNDHGETWDTTYSTGIPENAIPVKMNVVYNKNTEERTIYVATFNEGFYVSYNSGKNFEPINDGIETIKYSIYEYIFGYDIEVTDDGRIFGMTGITYYNSEQQAGKVFELINGVWQQINLPEGAICPRDIYYKNGVLYISVTANYKADNTSGRIINYAGGIYSYSNGEVKQIFDEKISVSGVQIDNDGNMYISDMHGNVYIKNDQMNFEKVYSNFHWISCGIQLKEDNYNQKILDLPSWGGGLLRLKISY